MRHEVIQPPVKEVALQWFDHWKRDVEGYWRVRDVVISRATRGDRNAQLIDKVLQDVEQHQQIPLVELLGALWLLRELLEGNDVMGV